MHAIIDKKTKTYHRIDCDCIKDIDEKDRVELNLTIFEYYLQGYKPCEKCSELVKRYKQEEKDIKQFCFENAMTCRLRDESLLIDTYFSSWKIIFTFRSTSGLLLYHENNQAYYTCQTVNGDIIKKYHYQYDIHSDTIMGYLKYIVEHDKWRQYNNTRYKRVGKSTRTKRYLYKKNAKKNKMRTTTRVYNLLEELQAKEN